MMDADLEIITAGRDLAGQRMRGDQESRLLFSPFSCNNMRHTVGVGHHGLRETDVLERKQLASTSPHFRTL